MKNHAVIFGHQALRSSSALRALSNTPIGGRVGGRNGEGGHRVTQKTLSAVPQRVLPRQGLISVLLQKGCGKCGRGRFLLGSSAGPYRANRASAGKLILKTGLYGRFRRLGQSGGWCERSAPGYSSGVLPQDNLSGSVDCSPRI